ncbi:MAG TPA: hypothetical protein VH859_08510 [Candidatus Limnocylindria bacterium]|jgi:hypothetical protein
MTEPDTNDGRRRRTRRLRADWRKDTNESQAAQSRPDQDADRRRNNDALGSNDRIRGEAPDDLETRRRADELEREIKRSRDPKS